MALKTDGQERAVLERLQAEIANQEMAPARGMLFAWWLSEVSAQGLTNEFKAAYLETLGRDDELARAGYEIAEEFHARSGDGAGGRAWMRTLLDKGLPADLRPRAWMVIVSACREMGALDAFLADVPAVVGTLPAAEAEQVVAVAVQGALAGQRYALAEQLVEAVARDGAGQPGLERFVRLSRLDILLVSDRLAEAEALLWAHADVIADGDLSPRASRLFAAWLGLSQGESATAFAQRALSDLTDRPMTRDSVAAAWVRAAGEARDANAFMDRLSACLDANVGVGRLATEFDRGYYAVMAGGVAAEQRRCIGLAARMQASPGLPIYVVERLALMRLDGAFYTQDYRSALDIVKAGVPGHDAEWHAVLTNKIEAHIALAEQRPEDAIRFFRAHMETVAGWKEPETNPENGVMMHKEAVLGFNEKRIGDIYAGMGRAADASACYRKARGYYEQALARVAEDSEEHRVYEAERAAVPQEPQPR